MSTFSPAKIIGSEQNLVNLFERTLKNKLGSDNISYLREFDCSDGIADLVICEHRKNWGINSDIGKIPPRWAFSLFKLPYRKNFSTNDFAMMAGVSRKSALTVLKIFAEFGFCEKKIKKDLWVKIKQPIPITKKIYAIEGKLRNWQRALSQAFRYLEYANQSWVVLDKKNINPALENINRFKSLNIGLASINPDGNVDNHYTPLIYPPRSPLKIWQANAEIARSLIFLNDFCKKCL